MSKKTKLKLVAESSGLAQPDLPDVTGKCGSCRYADMGSDGRAFCRRYPAQLVGMPLQALFPVVDLAKDWCGEHTPL